MISFIDKYWIRTKFQNDMVSLSLYHMLNAFKWAHFVITKPTRKPDNISKISHSDQMCFILNDWKISYIEIGNATSTPQIFHHRK